MTELIYCANACTRRHGDEWHPATTEPPSQLCSQCETRLHAWLGRIPDNYALLPTFLEHGTTERNPESKATKSATAPAPMRLDIIDLLDTRHGRRWNGLAPAHDRRGVIGTLRVHVERLMEERPLTATWDDTSVTEACKLLDRHRLWLAEQDWIDLLYEDLRQLNRELSDAVGDYRRPPVGRCHIVNDADTECGGPLYANDYGGVRCLRCGSTWDADHLAQLGLAQAMRDPDEATAQEIQHLYGVKPSTLRTWAERGAVRKLGRNKRGQQLYDAPQAKALAERQELTA